MALMRFVTATIPFLGRLLSMLLVIPSLPGAFFVSEFLMMAATSPGEWSFSASFKICPSRFRAILLASVSCLMYILRSLLWLVIFLRRFAGNSLRATGTSADLCPRPGFIQDGPTKFDISPGKMEQININELNTEVSNTITRKVCALSTKKYDKLSVKTAQLINERRDTHRDAPRYKTLNKQDVYQTLYSQSVQQPNQIKQKPIILNVESQEIQEICGPEFRAALNSMKNYKTPGENR
ncbi:hypothetical protein HUJ04_008279 [Dendroctonus ponderosae]|nr:hypothetical protein HUJ04_008279 [Dendroctonus ponderosae]